MLIGRSLASIACHAADRDTGDLVCCVEAEQQTCGVAARENGRHLVEGLLTVLSGLHDFGAFGDAPCALRSCDILPTASSVTCAKKAGA